MNVHAWFLPNDRKALYRTGYVLAALVALTPISPVIALMWLARWVHRHDAQVESENVSDDSSSFTHYLSGSYRVTRLHQPATALMTPSTAADNAGRSRGCRFEHQGTASA